MVVVIPIGFEAPSELADETLHVSEGGRLVIGAWAGSVNVSAANGSTVRVAVRGRGLLPPPALEIQRDGADVYVDLQSAPLVGWLPLWTWRHLELEVSVPARFSVEVRTRRGRVDVRGVAGEVDASSQGGPLVFRDIRGPIDARTADGSIDVSGCRGDVDVGTAHGSIEIRNVEGQVTAHSRGGRIEVLDRAHGLLVQSGGGSIQIEGAGALAFA
jgi:hypothetical protein